MNNIQNVTQAEVLALGRLYEFCTNQRFHLIKNEFLKDNIGQKALEINSNIKSTEGIDLFEAKTTDDLLIYEKILNQYLSTTIHKIKNITNIGDEIELFKASAIYPIGKMNSYNYKMSNTIKQFIKQINITIPEFISLCKRPDYVTYVDDSQSFFITSHLKIGNKQKIVLAHLSNSSTIDTNTKVLGYSDRTRIFRTGAYPKSDSNKNEFDIRIFFILSKEKFGNLFNNPIQLFIKCLDLYGANIEINHVVKKFFRNSVLPPHIELTPDFYKIIGDSESSRTVSAVSLSDIANKIIYLYSIYIQRHLLDYKNGKI